MYDKSQMMRGTLEGCILKIISLEPTYGYEIVTKLQEFGFEDIKEGTIYPLLMRLEKKEYIQSEFRSSPFGPSRKYYFLAEQGIKLLDDFTICWQSISDTVNTILNMEE
jgi:PadR family transcriptional regulator PadR